MPNSETPFRELLRQYERKLYGLSPSERLHCPSVVAAIRAKHEEILGEAMQGDYKARFHPSRKGSMNPDTVDELDGFRIFYEVGEVAPRAIEVIRLHGDEQTKILHILHFNDPAHTPMPTVDYRPIYEAYDFSDAPVARGEMHYGTSTNRWFTGSTFTMGQTYTPMPPPGNRAPTPGRGARLNRYPTYGELRRRMGG